MLVFFSFKNAANTKILKETFVGLGFGFAQNLAICLFLCVFSLVLTDFYSEESTFVEEASQCTRESRWHVVCLASCSMQKWSHSNQWDKGCAWIIGTRHNAQLSWESRIIRESHAKVWAVFSDAITMNLVILPASQFSLLYFFFLVEVAFALPTLTLCCLSFALLGIDMLLAHVVGRAFWRCSQDSVLGACVEQGSLHGMHQPCLTQSTRCQDAGRTESRALVPRGDEQEGGRGAAKERWRLLGQEEYHQPGILRPHWHAQRPGQTLAARGPRRHGEHRAEYGLHWPPFLRQSPLGHCTGDHFPFSTHICLLSPDSHSSGTLETRPRGLTFRPKSDYWSLWLEPHATYKTWKFTRTQVVSLNSHVL